VKIGRGQTFVKQNAKALGGKKVKGVWLKPKQAGEVWRFDPDFDFESALAVPA
jgi:hypothetical protein